MVSEWHLEDMPKWRRVGVILLGASSMLLLISLGGSFLGWILKLLAAGKEDE